jgi:hypothetical protein
MAAGWLRRLAADTVDVRTAGSEPADRINPVAVAAMREVGIDITDQTPKLLDRERSGGVAELAVVVSSTIAAPVTANVPNGMRTTRGDEPWLYTTLHAPDVADALGIPATQLRSIGTCSQPPAVCRYPTIGPAAATSIGRIRICWTRMESIRRPMVRAVLRRELPETPASEEPMGSPPGLQPCFVGRAGLAT